MRRAVLALIAIALVAVSAAAAATQDTRLTLVAYSTPREAYAEIIPAFQKTEAGQDVSFSQSYGSSGEQSRAVAAGLKADIVALSLAPDVDSLVKAGLVDAKWDRQSYRGIVHRSVVVFVVRDGNPKQIKGWNDLLRPGVEVITPNPFTSGGARWNIMAAYGAWRRTGKTDKQAQANLLRLFQNVSVQDKSARESLQTFASGKGDVLLAYENEALFARSRGQNIQFTDPAPDDPDREPGRGAEDERAQGTGGGVPPLPPLPGVAADLCQERLPAGAEVGRRRVQAAVPDRPGLFTIEDKAMGGWDKVQKRFFDPKTGIMARIQRQVGGDTG